ncbi:MAG: hypothetical protein AAFS02_16680 [Pseudomonadota bacterium]
MPRKLWLVSLAAIAAISAHAAPPKFDEVAILEQLAAHQPDGFGPPAIVDMAQGIVRGDVAVTAVLFTFQIGPSQDRNHWSYLIVFGYGDPIGPVLVGGGSQHLDSIVIDDRTIVLSGKTYADEDPRCCPSTEALIRYGIAQKQLMPLATRHNQSSQLTRSVCHEPSGHY